MQEPSKKVSRIIQLKFFATIVNIIVLFCEFALVTAVVYVSTTEKATLVQSFGQKTYEFSFGAVISIGVVVILFTLLGSLGAIRGNSFLLKIYCSLMFILLIGEVGTLAYTATQINVTSKFAEVALYDSLTHYNSSPIITRAWDAFQQKNECCGMRQSKTSKVPPYQAFSQANLSHTVPESCCSPNLVEINTRKCLNGSEYFIHKSDCYVILEQQLSESYYLIVAIGAIKVILTASGLILTLKLLTSI